MTHTPLDRSNAAYGSVRGRRQGRDGLTIAQLAASLETTVRALRYYEESGVLTPDRNTGNARRYGSDARERATLVVALRRVGVPMSDIEAALSDAPGRLTHLETVLRTRLATARSQVTELRRLLDAMEGLSREPDCSATQSGPRLTAATLKAKSLDDASFRQKSGGS